MVPNFAPSLEELRRSILSQGVQNEVYFLHGLLIDGRKRLEVCSQEGLICPERHFLTPQDAAPALWIRHRERCVQLFPAATITEAAELYACDLAAVSFAFAKPKPLAPEPGYWKRFESVRETQHYNTRMSPELWNQLGKVAKKSAWRRSHLIRIACAFALDNMDQIMEFDRIYGRRLRVTTGPRGPTGPKQRQRSPRPKGKKWAGQ